MVGRSKKTAVWYLKNSMKMIASIYTIRNSF